nr:uncharacterized protein LOC129381449 [Dermacentor andersoni]
MGWSHLLLVVFVHAVSVLVAAPPAAGSPCTPNFCSKVTCKPVEASQCDGKVVPNASYCGCCEQCVMPLYEGDGCLPSKKFHPKKYGECRNGLKCNETTFRCDKVHARHFWGTKDKAAAEMDEVIAFH